MQTLKLIVREVRQESPLIRSFRLARDGGALPAFGPGAHLNISVPGLREPRSYSLVQLTPDAGVSPRPANTAWACAWRKTARAARATCTRWSRATRWPPRARATTFRCTKRRPATSRCC